jgi:hypothetical protein
MGVESLNKPVFHLHIPLAPLIHEGDERPLARPFGGTAKGKKGAERRRKEPQGNISWQRPSERDIKADFGGTSSLGFKQNDWGKRD